MKKSIPNMTHQGCKPEINYPCTWQYKVIGEQRDQLIEVIEQVVGCRKEYLLTDSKTSSKGRYISMGVELVVENEEERLLVFNQLAANPAVRVVI